MQKKNLHGLLVAMLVILLLLMCVGCTNRAEDDRDSTNSENETIEYSEADSLPDHRNPYVENGMETDSEVINQESEFFEPTDDEMVRVLDYIPDMVIDLKYATTENFTGQVIYDDSDAYLRYGTVKKLMQVQEALKAKGYKLVLWDGYRPVAAQYKLWDICPDSRYVANPNKGFSKHSRGNTVDITIVTLEGQVVEMPTGFDDFTKKADREYSDVSMKAAQNSQMLEDIMIEAGFSGYSGEWWHYSDTTEYPVIQ